MNRHPHLIIITAVAGLLCAFYLCGCSGNTGHAEQANRYPDIFPDYINVTVPVNIAPLNFGLPDDCERIKVQFLYDGQTLLKCGGKRKIKIPVGAWRNILQQVAGNALQVQVYARQSGRWYAYRPFNIQVAPDSIDPYIVYRLIEPAYGLWGRMGIYQRNLSNFDESAIIANQLTGNNCMNCHSFHNYNPERMMFHSRGEKFPGTFLLADGKMQRVNTKTEQAATAGSYPIWHPSGNYIAFSANSTNQAFHTLTGKKIEVFDLESDLIIWDIRNGTMLRDARFTTKQIWETFPAWSPDGKWLYYCVAEGKEMPIESEQLMYGLCRVNFDAATGRFGGQIDTIINPATSGKSVSFPRLSPDGRYLLYTASAYATFPVWHKEAELEMIDLHDGSMIDMQAVNSDDTESYHAWSSNGRWVVFSSRRIDGLYTHPFFAYFDSSGQIHKPFLLPQKDPEFYTRLLKSYNIPEFVKNKVELNPYEISKALDGTIVNLKEIIQEK